MQFAHACAHRETPGKCLLEINNVSAHVSSQGERGPAGETGGRVSAAVFF